MSASSVFTGMHSLIDVLAGAGVFALIFSYAAIWQRVGRLRGLDLAMSR